MVFDSVVTLGECEKLSLLLCPKLKCCPKFPDTFKFMKNGLKCSPVRVGSAVWSNVALMLLFSSLEAGLE